MKNDFTTLNETNHTAKEWHDMMDSLHKQETKVPRWVYWHFLEAVPPIYSKQTGFLLGEPDDHDEDGNALRLWFYGTEEKGFYGQLVNEKYHIGGKQ